MVAAHDRLAARDHVAIEAPLESGKGQREVVEQHGFAVALSDALEPSAGEDSLRYALLAVSMVFLWAAFHFWRSAKTLVADIEFAQRASEAS